MSIRYAKGPASDGSIGFTTRSNTRSNTPVLEQSSTKYTVNKNIQEIKNQILPITSLYSVHFGTTDGASPIWQNWTNNKHIKKLLATISFPIYHIICEDNEDMGYNSHGDRAPCIESTDIYIWTISHMNRPIVYKYHVNSYGANLSQIIENEEKIRSIYLSNDDGYYYDSDKPSECSIIYNTFQYLI